MLTITAISGWAVPENWFAEQVKTAFPNSDLKVFYPEEPENSEEAKKILSEFNYVSNDAYLHTDNNLMPNKKNAWFIRRIRHNIYWLSVMVHFSCMEIIESQK